MHTCAHVINVYERFVNITTGTITIDEGGKVLTKTCGDCGRNHDGKEQICKECGVKLPSGARQAQYPMRREHFGRGEDNYWILMAQIRVGKKLARNEEEQEQWKRRETLWKRVVKTWESRGRGRDADAPAGGPRGPNSDDPPDEEYDNYDYNINEDNDEDMEGMKKRTHEDPRGHKRTRKEERNGEKW